MNDQKNMILAISLSVIVLVGFTFVQTMMAPPPPPPQETRAGDASPVPSPGQAPGQASDPSAPSAPAAVPRLPSAAEIAAATREALKTVPRVRIDTPRIEGSLSLVGARLDDVVLKDYHETLEDESPLIRLLRPVHGPRPYYVEQGWVPDSGGEATALPTKETAWTADRDTLAPGAPVTLSWDNGAGLTFERRYEIDANYLVTVTQTVTNRGGAAVTLFPYALVSRAGTPSTSQMYILHEGPIGVIGGSLREVDYDDVQDDAVISETSDGGWIGITDKYWLAAVMPRDQAESVTYRFTHRLSENDDRYQVDFTGAGRVVQPGGSASASTLLFVGAKEVTLIDTYSETYGITNFDLAVDFGWFYFLTKPFFYALHFLYGVLGNFGIAILAFTVLVKLVFFPLANKSYKSMAKLRELTPKMQVLREQYGEDKQRLNQEMMKLYQQEKVNPMSGCLPVLIQIPVFFALYKVLFVSIEMRHAPFFGWIQDLSARDPTTFTNAFGLIPWTPPDIVHIGAWPILMGLTMWLQQRLNPQPTDPVQAKVFMFLPFFFTFLLAQFAAGLVIYWTWNNLLSILQQWVIMKRMGVK